MFGHEKDVISEPDAQTHPAHDGELEKAGLSYDDEDDSAGQPIDPMAEKRLLRKLDRNIIPLVMALCTILLQLYLMMLLLTLWQRSSRIFGSK